MKTNKKIFIGCVVLLSLLLLLQYFKSFHYTSGGTKLSKSPDVLIEFGTKFNQDIW